MCGFFGWFGEAPTGTDVVTRAERQIRHRGPDDFGFEMGAGWALGFRRLSIIELTAAGHQPMSSDDGRFWLVFNGEIYNYVEVRAELIARGESFRTKTDTEVLLKILVNEGCAGLSRLNGMFAFAFVDVREQRFILGRDRLGVKPLYFRVGKAGLYFASELKALLELCDERPNLGMSAVAEFLSIGYVVGRHSVFAECEKLSPGHLLIGSIKDFRHAKEVRYWEVRMDDDSTSGEIGHERNAEADRLDELEHLIQSAVSIRLRSDVKVGVFLSGGIDSGLIAHYASLAPGHSPVALTVSYPGEKEDEAELARASAEHAGLQHVVVRQEVQGLAQLDRLAWHFDEPFGDPSALAMFSLCEAAQSYATVLLSGDGGDEAFVGYLRYAKVLRTAALIRMGSKLGRACRLGASFLPRVSLLRYRLEKISLPDCGAAGFYDECPFDPVLELVMGESLRCQMRAFNPMGVWRRSTGLPLTLRQQKFDYEVYLPDDVLTKVDRASMAFSLEVRSPFLDYRIVEWAARQRRQTFLDAGEGKKPLRRLGSRVLPPIVVNGRKRGFSVPLDSWFEKRDGVDFARDRLLSSDSPIRDIVNCRGIEFLLNYHCSRKGRRFGLLIWRLLMLDAWSRHYLVPKRIPPMFTSSQPSIAAHLAL